VVAQVGREAGLQFACVCVGCEVPPEREDCSCVPLLFSIESFFAVVCDVVFVFFGVSSILCRGNSVDYV